MQSIYKPNVNRQLAKCQLAYQSSINQCQPLHSFLKLIIHQVKTKEIATVKEVWIPGLN